jgi:hypothetical protein
MSKILPTPEQKIRSEKRLCKSIGCIAALSSGLHGGGLLGLGRQSFSFEVAHPAFAFFGLVVLFAHISVFTSAL